ncbi:hypothetical protein GGD61_008019 [Bradyrhizobium sp. SBR1B]|nr:hypothetical protein [Bradyrhizobium sp. SBR1B]
MPTNWTGVYLGGTTGAGKGRSHYADPFPTPASGDYADLASALFGGQIGINYQTGSWVLGLEASGYWANIRGTNTCFGASRTRRLPASTAAARSTLLAL